MHSRETGGRWTCQRAFGVVVAAGEVEITCGVQLGRAHGHSTWFVTRRSRFSRRKRLPFFSTRARQSAAIVRPRRRVIWPCETPAAVASAACRRRLERVGGRLSLFTAHAARARPYHRRKRHPNSLWPLCSARSPAVGPICSRFTSSDTGPRCV